MAYVADDVALSVHAFRAHDGEEFPVVGLHVGRKVIYLTDHACQRLHDGLREIYQHIDLDDYIRAKLGGDRPECQ